MDPTTVVIAVSTGVIAGIAVLTFLYNVYRDSRTRRAALEPPSTTGTALYQLTKPPDDFTGRETEKAELLARIDGGGVAIFGMGGIGKTALALVLAHELAPRYPDAQIYLDLKGTSREPLSPTEAMAHVIRSFNRETSVPEDEAELQGLYRSVLHDQRALLLMDNAADAAQVQPLIPPDGCVLLVTSRQRFDLPGLFLVDLDTLSPGDSCALLLLIAPRIGDQAEAIAQLSGYLPMALELAGRALAERVDLSPAQYLERLNEAQLRFQEVDASLTLSYDLLTPELQRSWRTLAVFPGHFDAPAAAEVWQAETGPAQDSLGALLNYSLLDWDSDFQRYRLHDLARDLADSLLADEERANAQQRHAARFHDVLGTASQLYLGGGAQMMLGLALFDLEWDNIQAGQAWAEAHTEETDSAATLCSEYSNAGNLLGLRQTPRERIRWLEASLAAARRLRDGQAEGGHLGNLGIAYRQLGEYHRAIEIQEQRLLIAKEIGDREGEGNALGNLGSAYREAGEPRRAIEFHEQRLEVAREIGDRRGEGHALGNLSNAYRELDEPRRAIEYSVQALVIFREIGDRHGEGNVMGNLGGAYFDLDEPRQAIEYCEQALEIDREIGDRHGEGTDLWNLGLALDRLGDRNKAIQRAEASLLIREEIEDPRADQVRERLAQWRGEQGSG